MRLAAHDEQHIVHAAVHLAVADFLSALRQRRHDLFLILRWLQGDVVIMRLRHGELEHIRRLNVRHIFEYAHQLRQVIKLGEARLGPVAGSLGNEFVKMISVSFLNSNIYPLKNLLTSRVCISLETPYSKASSHFPIASHLQ